MTSRTKETKTKKRKRTLFIVVILLVCGTLGFLSVTYFERIFLKRETDIVYVNEGMDLYISVVNNYETYISTMMGVAFTIHDDLKDKPDIQQQFDDQIVALSAFVYSYNIEKASNKLDSLILEDYVDQDKLATPIKMYRDQGHQLDLTIIQYNTYATANQLRTITNYDSIRLLMSDRANKDNLLKNTERAN